VTICRISGRHKKGQVRLRQKSTEIFIRLDPLMTEEQIDAVANRLWWCVVASIQTTTDGG